LYVLCYLHFVCPTQITHDIIYISLNKCFVQTKTYVLYVLCYLHFVCPTQNFIIFYLFVKRYYIVAPNPNVIAMFYRRSPRPPHQQAMEVVSCPPEKTSVSLTARSSSSECWTRKLHRLVGALFFM